MRYCMTERTLSARLAPSLVRLRHFDLCWVSSSKFKDQWSNLRKISGQVKIIWVGFQLFQLFLVTVKAVSRDVREYWFMARALIVECFELTAASDLDDVKFGSSLPVFFCCYRLVLALTRRAFCHWDKQNSFKENLPMSSDIYPFSNLKASFIIFYVNWNIATVALDCDLLTTF